jgi:hypothetical protein
MSLNALPNENVFVEHREIDENEFKRLMMLDDLEELDNVNDSEEVVAIPNDLVNGVLFNVHPLELLPEELTSTWREMRTSSNLFIADDHCVNEIYEHLWTYWITIELCKLIREEMYQCHCNECDTCRRRWDLETRADRLNKDEILSYQYMLYKINNRVSGAFSSWLPESLRSLPNPYINPIDKKNFLSERPITLYAEFPDNKRAAQRTLVRRIHHVIDECARRQRDQER